MPARRLTETGGDPIRDAIRTLRRVALVVRSALLMAGAVSLLSQVGPFASDAQFTWGERRVAAMVAVASLGGFALAGWAAGAVLDAASAMLGAIADGAEAAKRASVLVEVQLVPALLRAATAMEGLAEGPRGDDRATVVAEIRTAIREGGWRKAGRLMQDLERGHPDSPERSTLATQLADARRARSTEVARRLDEAIATEDAETAIALRDELTRHVEGAALRDLDSRVARWLVGWVRGRVRRGAFTPDLAEVASRGADRFGDVAEGRSLLAAVPDLRRRAGLCPSCARPYRGDAKACPACSDTETSGRRAGGPSTRGNA